MPIYEYTAYNQNGKLSTGLLGAPSRKIAYDRLKGKGLYPKDLHLDTASDSSASVSKDSLSFVLTQLSSLLAAGIPMVSALDSIITQVDSKALGRSLARLKTAMEEGKSFSEGLANDKMFPPLLVKMAYAGESVGNLELILERYASFLEKESQSAKKIIGALIYPMVIMTASTALVMFILAYIAPTLTEVFDNFNKKLPLTTQILVSMGSFLRDYSIVILLLIAAGIYCYIKYVPKKFKDNLKLSMPFVGQAYRYTMLSRWSRTLGLLHGGSVPLLKALESARDVVDNVSLEKELVTVEKSVEKGLSLSASLSRYFPPLLVNMVETGQQTGELEKMMNVVADFYEKEADRRLSLFIQLFEPAMILILGGVVGFVVISILLPIFEVNRIVK